MALNEAYSPLCGFSEGEDNLNFELEKKLPKKDRTADNKELVLTPEILGIKNKE